MLNTRSDTSLSSTIISSFAFIIANSSLEPLLEDPLDQIHMDLSFRCLGDIKPETEWGCLGGIESGTWITIIF